MNASSMLSGGSMKNTPLLLNQEPVSSPAPPPPDDAAGSIPQISEIPLLTGTTDQTNEVQGNSTSTVPRIYMTNPPAPAARDRDPNGDPPRDVHDSKMKELVPQLAVMAISVPLLASSPPVVAPDNKNLLVPYNAYQVLLCASLFLSFDLCMFALVKPTPPSRPELGVARRRLTGISIGCLVVSVILRQVLVLSAKSMGYIGLSLLVIIGGVLLYLWYSWRKATRLLRRQTSPDSAEIQLADQV